MKQLQSTWLFLGSGFLFLLPCLELSAQGIMVNPGAQMVLNGNGVAVTINNGSLKNEGIVSSASNSTLKFEGAAATAGSVLGGGGTTLLNNLNINKTLNDVRMDGNVTATGNVLLNSGKVILNDQVLDLSNTGVIVNENNTNYISGLNGGAIHRTSVMNAPAAVNPGNIGVELSSGQNLGNVVIKRRYQQFNVSSSDISIRRYYEITPDNNNNLDADVRFYYLDEDLNGALENSLYVWISDNSGGTWAFVNRDASSMPLNYIQVNGLSKLGLVTLASPNIPFPLDLLYFTATLSSHNEGLLQWETAKEENVLSFEIQRAPDGKNFAAIGTQKAEFSPQAQKTYHYTDKSMLEGINYYRLKILDKDGVYTYSKIERLELSRQYKNQLLNVYPNPVRQNVWISLMSNASTSTTLHIYDILGKEVMSKEVSLATGINTIELKTGDLIDGNYMVRFSQPGIGVVKIVKNNQ